MKKILTITLVLAIALTLSACGTEKQEDLSENVNETANDSLIQTPVVPLTQKSNSINQIELTPTDNTGASSIATNNMERTLKDQKDLFKDYSGAIIKTNQGNIEVKFYPESPITVNNFMNLAQSGFYNETKFHRIIKDFMIQGGDPLTKKADTAAYGTGGPDYKFADEFNSHKLVAGSLAMANSGPGTNGSQFFIVTLDATPWLDGKHTNFGEVISGMDVVNKIEGAETGARDLPIQDIIVKSIELIK